MAQKQVLAPQSRQALVQALQSQSVLAQRMVLVKAAQPSLVLALRREQIQAPQPQLVAALCMEQIPATHLSLGLPFSRGFLFLRMSICHSSYLDRMSIYPSPFLNLAPQPFLLVLAPQPFLLVLALCMEQVQAPQLLELVLNV